MAMDFPFIRKKRFDYFLIWGHGLPFAQAILSMIRSDSDLSILRIETHKPRSIKKFVKEVYSFDYAPFQHLKSKTRYLLKTKPEVMIIFVLNSDVREEWVGEGMFRHIECARIRRIKNAVRDAFNPRKNGVRTEDHVIHASDNENQTDKLLKYLGHSSGIMLFKHKAHPFLSLPYHVPRIERFVLKKVPLAKIDCHLWTSRNLNNRQTSLEIVRCPLTDSPHYRFLTGEQHALDDYLAHIAGSRLTDDHSSENLTNLAYKFNYLKPPYTNNYIILNFDSKTNRYIIIDGLHRASIIAYQGRKACIAAVIMPKIEREKKSDSKFRFTT